MNRKFRDAWLSLPENFMSTTENIHLEHNYSSNARWHLFLSFHSAKEKRLKKDAGRHLWSLTNSVLLDTSVDTLGTFRSDTGHEMVDRENQTKRLSGTLSLADDSVSGDGYISREDLQQDELSKCICDTSQVCMFAQ